MIRIRGREGKEGNERKRERAIGRGEKRKEKGKKRERRVSQGREEKKKKRNKIGGDRDTRVSVWLEEDNATFSEPTGC